MTSQLPLVSIILPSFNHEVFLKRRIESIFAQTYPHFELIILDDASSDRSIDILCTYKSNPAISHFLINDTNSGNPYSQWRKGIYHAKGEYVWIAESDDFSHPEFLKECVLRMQNDTRVGLTFCKSFFTDDNGNRIQIDFPFFTALDNQQGTMSGKKFLENFLTERCGILNVSSVVFRKDVFNEFENSFKEISRYRYYGDWYIYVQIALRTNICYFDFPLNYFTKPLHSYSSNQETPRHFKEKIKLQNYILHQTKNRNNYNRTVDHLYYDIFNFVKTSSHAWFQKIALIIFIVLNDKNGPQRLASFLYQKTKR
jgi:glycosyltransferase involved in cell wall biosynthesis